MAQGTEHITLSPQAILNRAYDDPTETIKVQISNPMVASTFDIESKRFCDEVSPTNVTEFIRHFIYNQSDGSLNSTYDTDFSGAAYVVVGTARFCEELDIEKRCLQDSNSDKFIRHYVYDQGTGAFLRSYDTDLDGNAFTPVGTVAECAPGFDRFVIVSAERLTITDAAIVQLTVPVGAVYAELQVKFGEMVFTIDGTDPLNNGSIGYIVGDKGFFKLGEGDPDNSGSSAEMFDFKSIALVGDTVTLEVNYYEIV